MSVSGSDGWGLLLPALVFLVGVVLATCRRPRAGLALLVGVTGGLQTAQIGSVHVFCLVGVAWAVFGVFRERRGRIAPWPALLVLACVGLLASTALTGELVNSPLLAVQLLLLASTAALIAALADRTDVRHMLLGLLLTTTVACVMGVLQYVRILPHELFLGDDRPVGLYVEPDWLGTFAAIGLVLSFYRPPGRMRTALTVVHLAAVLLAAARAAWLALIVVGVVGYLAARFLPRELRPSGSWRLVVVTLVGGAVMLVANPTLHDFLLARIDGALGNDTDISAQARVQQAAGLFRLAELAPWHGLGLSASGRVGDSGHITYVGTVDNNVASNWVVGWWVDGGLLAVPLILLLVVAAARRLNDVTGLVLTVVIVSSLFSNAMLIPIAWLALGLCLVPVPRGTARAPAASDRAPDQLIQTTSTSTNSWETP